MFFISKKQLEAVIREQIAESINNVVALDPEKSYIFVLPDNIDKTEAAQAFEALRGELNFLVIQTDKMSVIEVS